MPTQAFGNYQLIKKLATGGMAEVWLARQIGIEGFNRHVVVKRILPHLAEDPEFVQMFLNEAKIAARFNHPNIAQIYDLGHTENSYFIAMEYIAGEDLGRLMRKAWSTGQWIARPLAIRIVAEACKGLYYAHTRKDESTGRPLEVVHRDISPQNILISFDGSVKVVDFGIAKAADQASLTKSGAIKGKFAYMAPEQAGGRPLDARTDLFALGLVLYELLTGVRPLKRDSELSTLQAALECAIDPPSVVAEVPSELDDVVMRALAKSPDDRYRDCGQFQMALEEFLISQRLVATSVQISELMETLFAERRAEEARLGAPNPASQDSVQSLPPSPSAPPSSARKSSQPSWPAEKSRTATAQADADEAGGPDMAAAPDIVELPDDREASDRREAPSWEAPAAAPVQPSRRYSSGPTQVPVDDDGNATSFARGTPAPMPRVETRQAPVASDAPLERRSKAQRRPTASHQSPAARVDDDDRGELPVDAAPRRPTGAQLKARRASSSHEMPEAPPRRSRSMEAVKAARAKSEEDEIDAALAAEKRRTRAALVRKVSGLLVALGIVGGLAWYALKRVGPLNFDRVPILLSVDTRPSTLVSVKHPPPSPGAPPQPDTVLGHTPLQQQSGVFVGDTVVMTNEDNCISAERLIKFGEPNTEHPIMETFGEGYLKLSTKPPMKGVSIYCFGHKVGEQGIRLKLYEGTHELELRGEGIADAYKFSVVIESNKTKEMTVSLNELAKAK